MRVDGWSPLGSRPGTDGAPATTRSRLFLLSAALWNLAAGAALVALPGRRARGVPAGPHAREVGVVVVAFGALYAFMAVRPIRTILVVSAVAKVVGGVSGLAAMHQGRRDAVAFVSLADAAWVPGFVVALRRR